MTTATRTTSESTKEAAKAPDATAEKKSEGEVRYIGATTRRILTIEDWRNVGAEGQKAAEWNFENNFRLPKSMFNEKALEYLKKDDRFRVTS